MNNALSVRFPNTTEKTLNTVKNSGYRTFGQSQNSLESVII